MPAKILAFDTLDTIENEVLFTRAALKADEDANDLISETDPWYALVDEARRKDREFRTSDMEATAGRAVANVRLDAACLAFGNDLLHTVGDRTRPRFVGFFPIAPTRWVKQPFDKQIIAVRGWLSITGDAVLDQHRAALDKHVQSAEASRLATAALAPKRGLNWEMRSELADTLTRARDGLHRALAERAEERNLPREWPNAFFRIEERNPPPEPAPTT